MNLITRYLLLAFTTGCLIHDATAADSVHTVLRGESLSSIARKHDVRLYDLMEWNKISGKSFIIPGQRLRLEPQAGKALVKSSVHVVKAGETMVRIAARHGLSLQQLCVWNRINNPNLIQVGMRLRLTAPLASEKLALQRKIIPQKPKVPVKPPTEDLVPTPTENPPGENLLLPPKPTEPQAMNQMPEPIGSGLFSWWRRQTVNDSLILPFAASTSSASQSEVLALSVFKGSEKCVPSDFPMQSLKKSLKCAPLICVKTLVPMTVAGISTMYGISIEETQKINGWVHPAKTILQVGSCVLVYDTRKDRASPALGTKYVTLEDSHIKGKARK